ncbi:MAG TPA: hypothetical protein VGG61_12865, partial [Gemmataceae bacterium]
MTNEARPERGVRCADEIREQLPAHGGFADSHRRFRKSDGRMIRFRKEDYKKIEVGEQVRGIERDRGRSERRRGQGQSSR